MFWTNEYIEKISSAQRLNPVKKMAQWIELRIYGNRLMLKNVTRAFEAFEKKINFFWSVATEIELLLYGDSLT